VCRDFKVGISEENVPILFKTFDTNGDGTLNYREFIEAVRDLLSQSRKEKVEEAFRFIDKDHNGVLDIEEIKSAYNVSKHPDVIQGKRTSEIVLCEFIETLEAHHGILNGSSADGMVSMEEFVEYYTNISSAIDSESEFTNLLKNTWGIQESNLRAQKTSDDKRK